MPPASDRPTEPPASGSSALPSDGEGVQAPADPLGDVLPADAHPSTREHFGAATRRPVPGIEERRITMDEYHDRAPEKIELLDGYLFSTGQSWYGRRWRADMLSLLLTNTGLEAAVRLAPREAWEEALRRIYGDRDVLTASPEGEAASEGGRGNGAGAPR